MPRNPVTYNLHWSCPQEGVGLGNVAVIGYALLTAYVYVTCFGGWETRC